MPRIAKDDAEEKENKTKLERYLEGVGNLARLQLVRQEDGRRTASRSKVLVDVDVLCRETFFVLDDMTQQVTYKELSCSRRRFRAGDISFVTSC